MKTAQQHFQSGAVALNAIRQTHNSRQGLPPGLICMHIGQDFNFYMHSHEWRKELELIKNIITQHAKRVNMGKTELNNLQSTIDVLYQGVPLMCEVVPPKH